MQVGDGERLVIALEARVADFEKKMKQAERRGTRSYTKLRGDSRSATRAMETDMMRSSARINQALATTSARIGSFGRTFAAGFVGGAIATALSGVSGGLGKVVKGIAEVGDQAKRAGVSVAAFQEWAFVAEQNRIGIDTMVDGLKELNIRADEFVAKGSGPAAEAFQRLGYGAAELKAKLEDPSALLAEIIGRLGKLDSAAQIRVADEVFGGSAGERFVQLIGQGEAGLQRTIATAHRVGAVMDEELIEKAAELDRKFHEIQATVGNFAKEAVVNFADVVGQIFSMRTELDELVRSGEQAQALLGKGVVDAIAEGGEGADAYAKDIGTIVLLYEQLADQAAALAPALEATAAHLYTFGENEAADQLASIAAEMRDVQRAIQDGDGSAEEFEGRLALLAVSARDAFDDIQSIDTAQFSGVIGGIDGLIRRIGAAIGKAQELRAALPGGGATTAGPVVPATEVGSFWDRDNDNLVNPGTPGLAPATSPRPRRPPPLLGEADLPSGGGGGGVAGYAKLVADTRAEVAKLQAEAAELVAVAASGRDVGNAMEFARKRAELLYAAQEDGREITPELREEIDRLAASYTEAGLAAEDAARKLQLIQENSERGAEALTDMFLSILDGSKSAGDALKGLLLEIARVQIKQGLLGLLGGGGGGGPLAFIGGLLGGARAAGGPVSAGKAYLVGERGPELMVPGASGTILPNHALNQAAKAQPMQGTLRLIVSAEEGQMFRPTIRAEAQGVAVEVTQQGLKSYDQGLPQRVRGISADPRVR